MHRLRLFLFISSIIFSGCAGTKHLPEGSEIFCEATKVRFLNPDMVNQKGKVKDALLTKAAPKLNSKFLGMFRIRLWLYTTVKEPKRKRGFRRWLKYKLGEPPAYYNAEESERASLVMEKYLEDNGYFRAQVYADTVMCKKNVQVDYAVTVEGQYFVRDILLPVDTGEVSTIINKNKRKLLIRPGDPYNMDLLKAQREKFATLVRSKGYYDFNREYIYYYVDSTVGNRKLDIYFRIKEPSDSTPHVKYFINHVTVYPVYSIDDTLGAANYDTLNGQGYTIIQPELFLKKRALLMNIRLRQGETFSQRKHANTVNRFLDMGIFKYVNIRYEKKGYDSLDVTMQLTPTNTQDITGEVNLNTSTGNFLGTGLGVSYAHHNLFKGGERLSLSANFNVELQIRSGNSFINTLEAIVRAELGFPRFMLLFKKNNAIDLPYVPRTKLGLTETFQSRVEYYTLNSVITEYSYDWRKTSKVRHIFTPFSVNNIHMFKTTPEFEDILEENPVLRSSFEDVLIIGNAYSFVYSGSETQADKSYGYLRPNIENAGNLLYFINSKSNPGQEPYKIFNRPYANYIKIDGDARYFLKLTRKHSLASRIIAGIAVPLGNSEVIPYMKQFFIGGSTSVRAWRLRALGPGSYENTDAETDDYFPDQTGDIKLELNLEYRFTMVKFLKGAVFVDAGNIWLLHDDPQRPGGQFEANRFYKEIAIGSGFGIRLDFDFLVIRTDVSMPLRKPSLPEGDRWTFDKLYFSDKDWRRENVIWNIAIGYPF